jgi:hypothetical protein
MDDLLRRMVRDRETVRRYEELQAAALRREAKRQAKGRRVREGIVVVSVVGTVVGVIGTAVRFVG